MKITSINKLGALMLMSTLFIAAGNAQQNTLSWNELMQQYNATRVEKFSADENIADFEAYLSLHPDQPLAQLYTGSSYCLQARDAIMLWDKLKATNTCIDQMDIGLNNAQQQYPSNSHELLDSYLTFGLTSASLPAFFQQKGNSQKILNKAKNHPDFGYLPNDLQQQVLDNLK